MRKFIQICQEKFKKDDDGRYSATFVKEAIVNRLEYYRRMEMVKISRYAVFTATFPAISGYKYYRGKGGVLEL